MILSEYTSKELIAQYGLRIPNGRVARTAEEAEDRCRDLEAEKFVIKAQIGAGGRGLAGGIRFAATPSAVRTEAAALLGSTLVTAQTGSAGETVNAVYVEAAIDIASDAFLAIVLDPLTAQPMLLASPSGGVDFEAEARSRPDLVSQLILDDRADVATFLSGIGLDQAKSAAEAVANARRAFVANDLSLLEINPFALSSGGDWIAVDAKIVIDGNALFRHPELESLIKDDARTKEERVAQENEINLVMLDGNIGVVVNGAGLGLATNDAIIDANGKPANFMDIRTSATSFQIARGVELLLENPKVEVILLNIHGGGMTVCDTVAEGLAFAYARNSRQLPVVARMAGENAEWAYRILNERKLPVTVADSISAAVDAAVSSVSKRVA